MTVRDSNSNYGVELILDLHECDPTTFTRDSLDTFFTQLCERIEMEKCVVHFWDDVGVPEEEQQTLPHKLLCYKINCRCSNLNSIIYCMRKHVLKIC